MHADRGPQNDLKGLTRTVSASTVKDTEACGRALQRLFQKKGREIPERFLMDFSCVENARP